MRQETLCQHFQKRLRLAESEGINIPLVAGDLKEIPYRETARLQGSYSRNVLQVKDAEGRFDPLV